MINWFLASNFLQDTMWIMSCKHKSCKVFQKYFWISKNLLNFSVIQRKVGLQCFIFFLYNDVLIIPVVDADLFGFRLYYYLRLTETKFRKKLLYCSVKDRLCPFILIYKHALSLSLSFFKLNTSIFASFFFEKLYSIYLAY